MSTTPKAKVNDTPAVGSLAQPANQFTGPDRLGLLNDVPPMFGLGQAAAPLTATNGVPTPKLGIGGAESPKTHG